MAATTDDLMLVLQQIVKILRANGLIANLPPNSSMDASTKAALTQALSDMKNT